MTNHLKKNLLKGVFFQRTRIIGATVMETMVFIVINIGFWISFVMLRKIQLPVRSYTLAATCLTSSTSTFAAPSGCSVRL